MSDKFTETNEDFLKEGFKKILQIKKNAIDNTYHTKDLEEKLKQDYAQFKDFKKKDDTIDTKKVKMSHIKLICSIITEAKELDIDSKGFLKKQSDLLTDLLNSFEDNDNNNKLFHLGVKKKPADLEETVMYITDYLNGNLNKDLIEALVQNTVKIKTFKEQTKEAKDEMGGQVPKDEIKVVETLAINNSIPYMEQKDADFNKANGIEKKTQAEEQFDLNDLNTLAKIVGVTVKDT